MAEETLENSSDNKELPVSPIAIVAVLFFIATITSQIVKLTLTKGKQRVSVITVGVAIFNFLLLIASLLMNIPGKVVNSFENLSEDWGNIAVGYGVVSLMVGSVIGLFMASLKARELRKYPHRKEIPGNWAYHFEYKKTPWAKRDKKKRIEGLRNGIYTTPEKVAMGLNEKDNDKIVSRYYSEASQHMLITGSSGSGKTITMQNLIRGDIENNVPLIIIDMKKSPAFAAKIAAWSKDFGRDFYHFSSGDLKDYDIKHSAGPSFYDPFASGTVTSKADMLLRMREYDTASAVYKANMQQLLQVLLRMISVASQNLDKEVETKDGKDSKKARIEDVIEWGRGGLWTVQSCLKHFKDLAAAVSGTSIEADANELANQMGSGGKTPIKHAADELAGQLRTILSSDYGEWLKTSANGRNIDLLELMDNPGNVVLFSLNSDSEPEFASFMGSIIMADVTNVAAARRNRQSQNFISVYIDEFQALNPESVKGLLEKARESKMGLTLAQQSFEQIIASSDHNGQAYLGSILDTCSNFIVHNGATEDSAERLSKLLGKETRTVRKSTHSTEGSMSSSTKNRGFDGSIHESIELEWIYGPEKFMALTSPSPSNNFKSTAVVVNKTPDEPEYSSKPGALAREMWVIPHDDVLKNYYEPGYRLEVEESDAMVSEISSIDDNGFITDENEVMDGIIPFAPINKQNENDYEGGFKFEQLEDEEENELMNARQKEASEPVANPVKKGGLPIPSELPVRKKATVRKPAESKQELVKEFKELQAKRRDLMDGLNVYESRGQEPPHVIVQELEEINGLLKNHPIQKALLKRKMNS